MSTGNHTAFQNMVAYFENIALGAGGPGSATLLTATGAQINAVAAPASRFVLVPDATPYTVLAADSQKTHVLPDFTATTTMNLPTGVAGMEYTFIGAAVAADAQNWVFTAQAGQFIRGGVSWLDTDAGPAAAETKTVFANGSSHVTLTVVVPTAGTQLYFLYDGTKWVLNGIVASITTPAFS